MGSLIKTGEVVKVEPEDIIHLYRYIKKYITLDPKEYLNFLDKLAKEDSDFYDDPFYDDFDFNSDFFIPNPCPLYVCFTTNFLLVPKYMYSEIPRILKNNTKVQHRDKIEYEKFSYFDVYRFDDKSDGEIEKVEFEVRFEVDFIPDCFLEKARIFALKLKVAASEPDNKSSNFYDKVLFEDRFCTFYRILPPLAFYEIKRFEEDLRKLRLVQGISYSKFPKWRRGGVVERIERIEEYMILFTNFLYTLYTGEFEKNTPERRLFEPFTKSLKELGDTFENALQGLKVLVKFTG